jgi:hypothetical protein
MRVDNVDFADLVSEGAHAYRMTGGQAFVTMKMLPHPAHPAVELWDAGRIVAPGAVVAFELRGFHKGHPARIVVRTAPSQRSAMEFRMGASSATREVEPSDAWQEITVDVPSTDSGVVAVEIRAEKSEVVVYHAWGVERR